MSPFEVSIHRTAQRALADIPPPAFGRIRDAILRLAHDPRPHGCTKLAGRDGWRIRVGDYRVLYDIDDEGRTVTILDVGHRQNVYR